MSKNVTIMPCLDMRNGRVVKGVHFVDIADAGDPVECARAYCAAGADELALLDINATFENRGTLLDVVRRTAQACTVPFTVGGGIRDVKTAGLDGAFHVLVIFGGCRRKRPTGAVIVRLARQRGLGDWERRLAAPP